MHPGKLLLASAPRAAPTRCPRSGRTGPAIDGWPRGRRRSSRVRQARAARVARGPGSCGGSRGAIDASRRDRCSASLGRAGRRTSGARATRRRPRRISSRPSTISNQTIRQVVRVSIGGERLRVVLSNAFGTAPVEIGAAHVALRDQRRDDQGVVGEAADVWRQLRRQDSAGATIVSDAVDLEVAAGQRPRRGPVSARAILAPDRRR